MFYGSGLSLFRAVPEAKVGICTDNTSTLLIFVSISDMHGNDNRRMFEKRNRCRTAIRHLFQQRIEGQARNDLWIMSSSSSHGTDRR